MPEREANEPEPLLLDLHLFLSFLTVKEEMKELAGITVFESRNSL